jgi:N-acyl-D-aspartate/D-glutamate deacylase
MEPSAAPIRHPLARTDRAGTRSLKSKPSHEGETRLHKSLDTTSYGRIQVGLAADITVFDPNTIIDHATFVSPHQYAEGVSYVIVNGQVLLDAGVHTGLLPGRVLRGPGYLPN